MSNRQAELDQRAGAALRRLRQESSMSQESVADEAGVDQSMLSKIERIGPGAAGWQRFCRVAAALGYEVEICLKPISETTGPQ